MFITAYQNETKLGTNLHYIKKIINIALGNKICPPYQRSDFCRTKNDEIVKKCPKKKKKSNLK